MNRYYQSIFAASFVFAAPLEAHADSLRCHGEIIDPGVTEQELLDTCGNPTKREGADWLYEIAGSSPMVVTIGNGVVMFIRCLYESDAGFGTQPLGDRP
jgi:hypothetical protein